MECTPGSDNEIEIAYKCGERLPINDEDEEDEVVNNDVAVCYCLPFDHLCGSFVTYLRIK